MVSGGRPPAGVFVTLLVLAAALTGCVNPAGGVLDASGAPEDAFSSTDVFPGDYDPQAHRLPERGPFGILNQEVALLSSTLDGVDIQVYVMRPAVPEGERVPVIVDAGPYYPALEGWDLSEISILADFVSHGYAFALVSVRGTGASGGCMDLMGPAERHDLDQAITWLGTQEWSNGNVGMVGGSYDGSTQWTAASTGNPHLKTIVPLAAIPDLFSFMVRNGTYMVWTPASFAAIYWAFYGPVLYNPATGRSVESTAEQLVCPESMKGMTVSVHSALTGERDPLGFWAARDWRDEVTENYRGSIYLIHGFRDVTVEPHTAYPWVNELAERGIVVKHTLGPWGHELPWRGDSLQILLHWYDRWLKEDASSDLGPRAQVMDNLGLWRSETAWPPADATPTTLHLTPEGALSAEPGGAGEAMVVGPLVPVKNPITMVTGLNGPFKVYEDAAVEACPACPTFETPALDEEMRFAGLPKLHVAVTPTGPGGHVTAILYVVDESGKADRVAFGQMDLRFADGGDAPKPVVPGQPIVARMELQPTDVAVPKGAKLVLKLHQGSYGIRVPSTPTYPVLLDASGDKSTLTLDVFERAPEDFHVPPEAPGDPTAPR